jgi:hypothetical protein
MMHGGILLSNASSNAVAGFNEAKSDIAMGFPTNRR